MGQWDTNIRTTCEHSRSQQKLCDLCASSKPSCEFGSLRAMQGGYPCAARAWLRQHRCPGEIQGIGRSVHSQHTRTFAGNARKIWKQLLEDEVSLQVSSMRWHNAKSMEMWKFGRKLFQTLWYQCLWPRKSNTVAVCRQFKNFWRSALNLSWGVGFWKLREMSIQLLYVGLWWIVFIWQACTLTNNPA